jgi:hypothetical protein
MSMTRRGFSRQRPALAGLFAACTVLCACTESHDIGGDQEELGGTAAGHAGSAAGRGGSAGRAGSAATAGRAAASGSSGSVDCSGSSCSGTNVFGLFQVSGCCTTDNKCGFDLSTLLGTPGCSEQNSPGAADTSCPTSSLAGFLTLDGCCKPDGTCGALDTLVGLGCVAASDTGMVTKCTPAK